MAFIEVHLTLPDKGGEGKGVRGGRLERIGIGSAPRHTELQLKNTRVPSWTPTARSARSDNAAHQSRGVLLFRADGVVDDEGRTSESATTEKGLERIRAPPSKVGVASQPLEGISTSALAAHRRQEMTKATRSKDRFKAAVGLGTGGSGKADVASQVQASLEGPADKKDTSTDADVVSARKSDDGKRTNIFTRTQSLGRGDPNLDDDRIRDMLGGMDHSFRDHRNNARIAMDTLFDELSAKHDGVVSDKDMRAMMKKLGTVAINEYDACLQKLLGQDRECRIDQVKIDRQMFMDWIARIVGRVPEENLPQEIPQAVRSSGADLPTLLVNGQTRRGMLKRASLAATVIRALQPGGQRRRGVDSDTVTDAVRAFKAGRGQPGSDDKDLMLFGKSPSDGHRHGTGSVGPRVHFSLSGVEIPADGVVDAARTPSKSKAWALVRRGSVAVKAVNMFSLMSSTSCDESAPE